MKSICPHCAKTECQVYYLFHLIYLYCCTQESWLLVLFHLGPEQYAFKESKNPSLAPARQVLISDVTSSVINTAFSIFSTWDMFVSVQAECSCPVSCSLLHKHNSQHPTVLWEVLIWGILPGHWQEMWFSPAVTHTYSLLSWTTYTLFQRGFSHDMKHGKRLALLYACQDF